MRKKKEDWDNNNIKIIKNKFTKNKINYNKIFSNNLFRIIIKITRKKSKIGSRKRMKGTTKILAKHKDLKIK